MSGIRPLSSTGNDAYNVQNVGTESESIGKATPVRPEYDANIQNQSGVGAAEGVSEKQGVDSVQESQDRIAREKKGLQESATERIAEEQLKAEMKKTQLANQLDSNTEKEKTEEVSASAADEKRTNETYDINWIEKDQQAIPHHRQDGSLQRWDVHDKAWE